MTTRQATTTMSTPIMVVGEALIDIVDGPAPKEIPGGSPANVALGVGRLGLPVDFVTWLGDDDRGHRVKDHLTASGVHLDVDVFGAAHTSTATVQIGPDGQPDYTFDISWNPPRRPSVPRRLHVGSLGAFINPGAHTVLDLVRRTTKAGGTVSFDPNIRPALLPDINIARDIFEQLARHADIAKLSDEDAAWLYPDDPTDIVLDHLHDLGVQFAVLTAGAEGATLSTAQHRVFAPAPVTTVIDTVGAGDTYMAALLSLTDPATTALQRLTADDLHVLGDACASAAAITVSRSGADLPWLADLPRLTDIPAPPTPGSDRTDSSPGRRTKTHR